MLALSEEGVGLKLTASIFVFNIKRRISCFCDYVFTLNQIVRIITLLVIVRMTGIDILWKFWFKYRLIVGRIWSIGCKDVSKLILYTFCFCIHHSAWIFNNCYRLWVFVRNVGCFIIKIFGYMWTYCLVLHIIFGNTIT